MISFLSWDLKGIGILFSTYDISSLSFIWIGHSNIDFDSLYFLRIKVRYHLIVWFEVEKSLEESYQCGMWILKKWRAFQNQVAIKRYFQRKIASGRIIHQPVGASSSSNNKPHLTAPTEAAQSNGVHFLAFLLCTSAPYLRRI